MGRNGHPCICVSGSPIVTCGTTQPYREKKKSSFDINERTKINAFYYLSTPPERERLSGCKKCVFVCEREDASVCVCVCVCVSQEYLKTQWDEINVLPWALLNHHLLRKNNLHLSYFIFHIGEFSSRFRKYIAWVPPKMKFIQHFRIRKCHI